MKFPQLYLGPMSPLVVDSVIEYAEEHQTTLGLIPSRRQVEYSGGYVNNWTTAGFSQYVRSRTDRVWLVRDHGGPSQGSIADAGYDSLYEDCFTLDLLHLDPWKVCDLEDAAEKTVKYLQFCYDRNPSLMFEVGTEEAIHGYDANQLNDFLAYLKFTLSATEYSRIKYVVIQSGTAIKDGVNIGAYNQERLQDMLAVCSKYDLLSKEHNGDYLSADLVKNKFAQGLHAINIAPEFGQIESSLLLAAIQDKPELVELFFNLCLVSGKWKKWLTNAENQDTVIKTTGHYVFAHPDFAPIRKYADDQKIKQAMKTRIHDIVG